MNIKFTIASLLLGLTGFGWLHGSHDVAEIDSKVLRYAGEVLARSEFGSKKHDVAKKWLRSPRLCVLTGDENQIKLTKRTIAHVNSALPPKIQIELIDRAKVDDADIKMHFVPFADFAKFAKAEGFTKPPKSTRAYFHIWWNSKKEIYKALILIGTDTLPTRMELEHGVLEEIVQALGPIGDTVVFPHSLFYEDNDKKVFGTTTRMSKIDKKLLRFLYEHVPPGAHQTEIGYLMAKHWK